jgi:hypothetical protein
MPFVQRSFVLLFTVLLCGMNSLNAQTTWTGAVSTAWNAAGNWSAGIPGASDDVIIPNVTNDPVISTTGAAARSVTVQSGGLLTISAAGVLSINSAATHGINNAGTVQNNGTIQLGNISGGWITSAMTNSGAFYNNAAAKLSIDRVETAGQTDALRNINTGTFENTGTITIGGIANGLIWSGGTYGLRNYGSFNNLQAGIIRVDKVMHFALANYENFTNNGQIILGSSPVPGNNSFNTGLNNGKDFINSSTGSIRIDNYTQEAIEASNYSVFENSGSIRVGEISDGTTVLTGNLTGLMNNNTGGRFEATGTVESNRFIGQGGMLSPGISGGSATAGWISFSSSYNLSNTALSIDVNGAGTPGVHYDQIGVNGIATLGGPLTLSFNNYTAVAGDQVVILTSSGIIGKFSSVTGLPAGWTLHYTATEVILSYGQLTGYNVWNGNSNTSWTNAANWSKGVAPTINDDVLIPAGTTNQPTLAGTGGRARSVTVQTGATLTITAAGILLINGSDKQGFYNQGTVTNNGNISIGNTSSTGFYGIVNAGNFNNGSTGKINIDRASISAFFAQENNINNAGTITVGALVYISNLIMNEGAGLFNNNTGGILKGAGDIYVNRFVNAGGTLSPGAPVGTMSFSAGKNFTNTILDIELNGKTTPGTDFDNIGVGGMATLGGTLNITVNYTPTAGDEISFLSATSVSGSFNTVNLPAGWAIQYLSNTVKLTYGQNYWTGAVSSNWHTAGNWSLGAVPDASQVVIIPDVTTDPVISAGAASAKTVTILTGGQLTINASQSLTINGSPVQGLLNEGSVQNSGTITIGNTATTGVNGIVNKGTFVNHPGSVINVDRIETYQGNGILNQAGRTFTNQGTIRTGAITGSSTSASNTNGLRNEGIFTNSATGKIYIDRAFRALYNFTQNQNSFTNQGEIIIGAEAAGAAMGEGILTLYNFSNAAGGKISIDKVNTGIEVSSFTGLEFINNGTITLGRSSSVPVLINIQTSGAFINKAGAVIEGSGLINNTSLFKNEGGTLMPNWSAPGNSFGKITFNTNQDLGNSILSLNVGGNATAGVDYDQVSVNGNLNIGGTLNVTVNYTPIPGDEITIISATSVSGTFTTTNIPAGWTLSYAANAVKLVFGDNDPNTWTGAVSAAWATAGNWSKGVPVAGSIVVIPDVARDPVISTTTAIARSVTVQSGGLLTITAAGSLTVNGTAPQSILNQGTVQNNGTITIGNTSATVTNIISNEGSFNNNTGAKLIIAKAAENTVTAIVNAAGSFSNSGTITIGSLANAGKFGIVNDASFENKAGGVITIGSINEIAVRHNSGTFTNAGSITFGATTGAAQYGVYNAAGFNNLGGQITIDRTTMAGIYNVTGTFTNTGNIRIGANAASGVDGISNTAIFNNGAAGQISIDRVSNAGISHAGNNTIDFSNQGSIHIGSVTGGNNFNIGIYNSAPFHHTGGQILLNRVATAVVTASGVFTNAAELTVGNITAVTNILLDNGGVFTNQTNGQIFGAGNIAPVRFSSNQGHISPAGAGSPTGIMHFTGNADLSGSTINIDVNGNGAAGINYDVITVNGAVEIDGVLQLNFNYAGADGDQITIVSATTVINKFVAVQGLPAGWTINYTSNAVILEYAQGTTWTGAVNTEWTLAGNWSNGVPIAQSVVIIPNATNDPVLNTASAALGNLSIQTGAQLTVGIAGTLTVNGNGEQNIFNEGMLTNDGTIGNISPIVNRFFYNTGTFINNATGQLIIAQVAPNAEAAILNEGNCTNYGIITIGSVATAGKYGILNAGPFTNATGAQINIARVTEAGISHSSSTFVNNGNIATGTVFNNNAKYGLYTSANFQNAGELRIQNVTATSIYHLSQTFTNAGTIRIGADGINGTDGIDNAATFNNEIAGMIYIDRNTNAGIYHHGSGFSNKGSISLNSLPVSGYTTLWGIYSDQPFSNEGGQIIINRVTSGIAANTNTFTNTGAVTIGNLVAVATLIANRGSGTFSNSTNGELKGSGAVDALRFVNAGGKLSPGYTAAGRISFTANENFANSIIDIKVNGAATATVNYDQVTVNGTATLTGATLNVSINYSPAAGDRITVLTATTLSGAFGTVTGLPANWSISYENNSAILVCDAVPAATATTWTGAVSSAWELAGNWSAGVPGDITDITIPDVTNDPVISTTTAVAKSILVMNGAMLTVTSTGVFSINNAVSQGLLNRGTIQNNGTIHIGSTHATGSYGIRNEGSFNNNATGKINIDRAGTAAIYNISGVFTNAGTIDIGASFATGADGLGNDGTFNNNAGALIRINRVTSAGIYSNGIDLVNKGTITIGDISAGNTFNYGIYIDGQLDNAGGVINIDRVNTALTTSNDHLYNTGIITIGELSTVPVLLSATGTGKLFNDTNGEFRGSGSIAAAKFEHGGGKLLPGNAAAGKMIFNGSESFTNSIMNIQVNGNGTAGVQFDQVEVQETATLGGTLALTMNYAGAAGDQITILTAAAVTGTFQTVTGLTANWKLKYTANAVVLEYDNVHYWTGNVSSAWNTTGNWSKGQTPGTGQSVVLPATGPVRELTVTIGATISSIEIAAGRTVTLASTGSITATSAFTNNGIIKGTGRIVFANFTNTGILAPGMSPGTLSITGSFNNQGTIQAEIGGTTAGTEYDQLAVSGAVTLGGNLVISTINDFKPVAGQTYTIITGSSVTGSFASVTWPAGISGTVTNTATGVNLSIVSVLPLTLLEFTGQAAGDKAILKWKTAEEVNTSHFEIERSVNGQSYITIGKVAAAGTGGNNYSFTDVKTVSGNNHYRLKMMDIDGSSRYSSVIIVKFTERGEVKLSPVPATSYVILTVKDRSLIGQHAQVFSPGGSLVADIVMAGSTRIAIAHLPSGIYTIKTSIGSYRFVKQ